MAHAGVPQSDGDVERLLKDYQTTQEQMRMVAMQHEQLQAQKLEMERAKEELDKASGRVYFSVGGVIVETTKEKALTDINERHSLTEARLQSINKQYADVKAREKQLNEELMKLYKQGQA